MSTPIQPLTWTEPAGGNFMKWWTRTDEEATGICRVCVKLGFRKFHWQGKNGHRGNSPVNVITRQAVSVTATSAQLVTTVIAVRATPNGHGHRGHSVYAPVLQSSQSHLSQRSRSQPGLVASAVNCFPNHESGIKLLIFLNPFIKYAG